MDYTSLFLSYFPPDSEGRPKTYVPPLSPTATEEPIAAVVGEQPGRTEVMTRKPFQGTSGKLLRACLSLASFNPMTLYFTNVLKDLDLPLEHYLKMPRSRRQSPEWIHDRARKYAQLLREEISLLPQTTNLLIAVGNVALHALTGRWGVTKWRGSLIPCLFDSRRFVIPVLHPASIIRGSTENKFLLVQDLKKAHYFLTSHFFVTSREAITRPSFPSVLSFLESCLEHGRAGNPISFDIETKSQELNCISFAISPTRAICIPFVQPGGDYFTPPQEAQIMRLINQILSSPVIRKVGQNLVFDTHFLLRKYGIRTVNIDDTMVAQHTLFPQLPKGLDMITSLWTDVPYYKDEGKEWMRGGGTYERLWNYNCLDSLTVLEALPKILRNLSLADNREAYERQLSIVPVCCYMMERGIHCNREKLVNSRRIMEAEVKAARKQLSEICPDLNINSPKQMQDYFYKKLRIPPYLNKKHKPSVDGEALKRISRKGEVGAKEASLILSIKKKEKLISTYLTDIKFDSDSRIRCSYNPVGTLYSRLSSSQSIFGTGMNMQNWPHAMLRFLEPDEGYIAYTMDLSQAENRIVAYVGRIEQMIHAFETGQDVHRLTASLIFSKSPEEISDEPGSCSMGNGESSERQWGKKANHGLNYDLGYKSFSIIFDLPIKEAKWIVERYHSSYPEVRQNFHGYVKQCLKETKTITNLKGRKTIFLSDLDDSTYKEAYSCIPQGTVGDIINEQGMAYIYYNRKMFAPVEILQQVHDSITFQIPLPPIVSWLEHARILQKIKTNLEQPLKTHYGRSFVIPVDTVMGLSLMKEEGKELKSKNWPATEEALASLLSSNYDQLLKEKEERYE